MGSPCATGPMTFNADKLGTKYAAAVLSQRVTPLAAAANPRRSSAKLPITNSEKANTDDISGDENDENNNARAVTIRNSSTIKYNATRMDESLACMWRET